MVMEGITLGMVTLNRVCEQGLPAGGAVDAGGLQHLAGNVLKSGDVDDHHIADLLPAHEDDQAPEAVFRLHQDGGGPAAEHAVKDHGPDVAEHDAADQVGHEEDGAVEVAALDALGQGVRHGEGQHVDEHQGHHGEQGGVPEGVAEGGVLKGPDVVAEADELGVGDGLELTHGQPDALEEGPDKADYKGGDHRSQKQRAPQPGGALDGVAVGYLFRFQSINSLSFYSTLQHCRQSPPRAARCQQF